MELEARIQAFQGDEERVELLRRARRFKASWIELGEVLQIALQERRFLRWGFASFDEYCRKELHLKPETAYKLTGSYAFLHKRAPEVLRRDGLSAPIPSADAVDFWRRVEERADGTEAPAAARQEPRRAVIEDAQPAAALKRRYQEVFFPLEPSDQAERDRVQLLAATRRLAQLLAATRLVPKPLVEEVDARLERLVVALQALQKAKPAASA